MRLNRNINTSQSILHSETNITCFFFPGIIDLVKSIPMDGEEPFRPDLELLLDSENGCNDYILQCMKDCWAENPEMRPDFPTIRTRLKKMKDGK